MNIFLKNSLEKLFLLLPSLNQREKLSNIFFSLFQSCSMANPYLRHTLLLYKGNFIILFIQGCLKKNEKFPSRFIFTQVGLVQA